MDCVITYSISFKKISSHSALVYNVMLSIRRLQSRGPLTNTLQSYRKGRVQKKYTQKKLYTIGFLQL